MSDDKTRMGVTPTDASGAHPRPTPDKPELSAPSGRPAEGSGSIRPPQDATIVLGNGTAPIAPSAHPTIPGLQLRSRTPSSGAGPSDATMVLGNAGPSPAPTAPGTFPQATPTPGSQPVMSPPSSEIGRAHV